MRASREAKAQATELAVARARIAELEERLAEVSSRDTVVPGLLSLAAFRGQLEVDVQRAHRYGRALSVALIDVDRFRCLNLEHGYAAGDAVLAAVGAAIARSVRGSDLACRTGGDEFAVLFTETDSSAAARAMERVVLELRNVDADERQRGQRLGGRRRASWLGGPRGTARPRPRRPRDGPLRRWRARVLGRRGRGGP